MNPTPTVCISVYVIYNTFYSFLGPYVNGIVGETSVQFSSGKCMVAWTGFVLSFSLRNQFIDLRNKCNVKLEMLASPLQCNKEIWLAASLCHKIEIKLNVLHYNFINFNVSIKFINIAYF